MKTWNKALTGLYVVVAEGVLQHLSGHLRESLMSRLQKEAVRPRLPLPALSSACSLLSRRGKLKKAERACFSAIQHVGPDLRTHGTEKAMRDYLTRFVKGL
jgi:hypothetical protein